MQKLILVTTPGSDAIQKVLDRIGSVPFYWTYIGQSVLEHRRVADQFHEQGQYLDTSDRFHHWTRELRDQYLAYLFDIGRKLNLLSWWVTPVSCRDSFVSNVFFQVCHLKTGLETAGTWENPEPLVLVADEPVCHSIRLGIEGSSETTVTACGVGLENPLSPIIDTLNMLGHRAVFVLREMYQIFHARKNFPRPSNPAGGESLIVSWGTANSLLQGGEFHRFFFGDLADRLDTLKERIVIVPMILREVRYKEALSRLKGSRLPVCLPHSIFGLFDPIKAALSSFIKPARPRPFPEFSGMDLELLFEPELRRYWVSNQSAALLMTTLLVRRWAKWSPSIARIIYMYENKPWERALCWQARRSLPSTKVVGYSPTPVAKLLLSFFLAPGEASIAPLPNRIVTVGEQPARLFSSDGYNPESVKVGGALRMQNISKMRSKNDSQPFMREPLVLIAPTLGFEETAELAYIATHLFAEDNGVKVILKCHPMMPFERVSQSIGMPLPSHVQLSDEPINDLILRSSVMIYSSSTVSIDALALEVPVVQLRPKFEICLDPLEDFSDLRPEAFGLEELRQKIETLLERRDEYIAKNSDDWANLVADMYSPVTPESIKAFTE